VTVVSPVLAAGAVVWRTGDDGVEVALVHRPRYDDWSFPKGKLEPGEHPLVAAVREVAEETGLAVRLGTGLPVQTYAVSDGATKHVHYWSARQTSAGDVTAYRPNAEIDKVRWMSLAKAEGRLTYPRDRDVLSAFQASPYRSEPLIVLRHARAKSRSTWRRPDVERTLSDEGKQQAQRLVPLLQSYGVERVLTSDAVRCAATVRPFAKQSLIDVEPDHRLSEDGLDTGRLRRRMSTLLEQSSVVIVCSHRPVLPLLFEALGLPDPGLRAGDFIVMHRDGGHVRATEKHVS
jgi:8-oxo-dGTP diphosphatase